MAGNRRRRDRALIDALEAIPPTAFEGSVWRSVGDGRDPLRCSASGGRWDDGTFDVLYTARERDGAIAESYFHLMRGQPVFPTRVTYRLFEIRVALERALCLPDLDALASVGYDVVRFGSLSYQDRPTEYPRTQEIAEVAHFLDFDGLIVPSARHASSNIVLFCSRLPPGAIEVVRDHGVIDWSAWKSA